jgi:ribosomal protein S16
MKYSDYNPISKEFSLDAEKAKKYISNGAQYSDTVAKLVAKFAA